MSRKKIQPISTKQPANKTPPSSSPPAGTSNADSVSAILGQPRIVDVNGDTLANNRPTMVEQAYNNNFWTWVRNTIDIVRNPDDIGVSVYDRMYRTDESVSSAMKFTILAALSKLGDYNHKSVRIEKFVQKAILGMDCSWTEAVREILTAIIYGFSVTEIIYKFVNGQVVFDTLQTLHPSTILLDMWREGPKKNRLSRVVQWYHNLFETVIPVEKCIIYTHNKSFGNHYGESRLRSAYKNWKIKDIALKSWALTCERYGSPITVAKVPGNVNFKINGKDIDAFTYMQKQIDNLATSQSGIVTDKEVDIDIKWAQRAYGPDFMQLVEYCNKMVFRACLVPSLIGDHGSHGSYSLGQKHYDLFVLELEKLLEEVIQVIIKQLIKPIVDYNFGPQSDNDYGDFSIENFEADDEKMISDVIVNLVNASLLNPYDIDDNNYCRDRMGIPVVDEARLAQWQAANNPQPATQPGQPGQDGTPDTPAGKADSGTVKHPPAAIQQPIPKMSQDDPITWEKLRRELLKMNTNHFTSLVNRNKTRRAYKSVAKRREERMRSMYRRELALTAADIMAQSGSIAA